MPGSVKEFGKFEKFENLWSRQWEVRACGRVQHSAWPKLYLPCMDETIEIILKLMKCS